LVGMAIKLYRGLYIADPWPAAYIEDMDALIFSDLHLGIEGSLEEEGIFLPRGVSRATADIVYSAIEEYRPSTVVFDGDLKHSFGLLKTSEWRELGSFFERLRDVYRVEVYVVRGNHDNYLGVLLDRFGYRFFGMRMLIRMSLGRWLYWVMNIPVSSLGMRLGGSIGLNASCGVTMVRRSSWYFPLYRSSPGGVTIRVMS